MDKAIEMNIGGIKCDTQDCDYNDMSVKVEDYLEWLNKPCPKCNGNLLTQVDYDNTQIMMKLVNMMNGILPPAKEDEKLYRMSVDMDGTGAIDLSIQEHDKE